MADQSGNTIDEHLWIRNRNDYFKFLMTFMQCVIRMLAPYRFNSDRTGHSVVPWHMTKLCAVAIRV